MSFQNRNLNVINYAGGWTLWHYITKDSIKDIESDKKYFKEISRLCACGDIFFIKSNGLSYARQIVRIQDEIVELGKLN